MMCATRAHAHVAAPRGGAPQSSSSSSSKTSSKTSSSSHRARTRCIVSSAASSSSSSSKTSSSKTSSKYAKAVGARITAPDVGERTCAVPYWNDEREKVVFVGERARRAVVASGAEDFIALPCVEKSSALRALREEIDAGWTTHEVLGCGHSSQWPEIFKAAEALIRDEFPSFGERCEILPGTNWLEDETQAIDWVIRRPEKHIIASKIHFATRLHRDPDSWTNPATSQRPRENWPELSMPNRERYQYRFINVWIATSALDPTGNAWQSPLVVMLPREGGRKEWMFEKRKLSMTSEGAKDENVLSDKFNPFDPKTWVRSGNRLTRGAYTSKKSVEEAAAAAEAREEEVRGEDGMTDAERAFEFPEVLHQDEQQFVTNGALVFDSFDCWHGAAKWSEDKLFKKKLTDLDSKGRQPFHQARCSIEMRFRVKIDMEDATTRVKWGPFTSAVRDGKFLTSPLRDSEAVYDLDAGRIVT